MYVTPIHPENEPIRTETGEIIYELIGKAVTSTLDTSHSLARIIVPPGKSSHPHFHKVSQETYFILEGEGQMRVDDNEFSIHTGQACHIEPGEVHQISNPGDKDLVFLAVCVPPWVPDDSFED
jgi:mannose-6-phosphate isomerase-like protein (cupin superfamily)